MICTQCKFYQYREEWYKSIQFILVDIIGVKITKGKTNMKKIIIILITMLFVVGIAEIPAQEVKREGNTFVQVSNLQQSHDTQTPYFYKVKEMSYSIWITPKGRCYIVRLSKNGNPYKQYLSKDICLQICEELNIQYQE